jgi:hypothetical protein
LLNDCWLLKKDSSVELTCYHLSKKIFTVITSFQDTVHLIEFRRDNCSVIGVHLLTPLIQTGFFQRTQLSKCHRLFIVGWKQAEYPKFFIPFCILIPAVVWYWVSLYLMIPSYQLSTRDGSSGQMTLGKRNSEDSEKHLSQCHIVQRKSHMLCDINLCLYGGKPVNNCLRYRMSSVRRDGETWNPSHTNYIKQSPEPNKTDNQIDCRKFKLL